MSMTTLRVAAGLVLASTAAFACPLPPKSAGEDPTGSATEATSSDPAPDTTVGPEADGPGQTSTASSSLDDTTATGPRASCRDAVDCIVGCYADLFRMPEPLHLGCPLQCEEGLSASESLALFELLECTTDKCIEQGVCDELAGTSTGTSTGSDDGTMGETTGTGQPPGDTDGPDLCLDCILANTLDPQPPGCVEQALACE